MKVLISCDSFKGSLTSLEANEAIYEGIKSANPNAKIELSPLADGGEGTMETLSSVFNAKIKKIEVHGPLNKIVSSTYGLVKNKRLAIIDCSKACGITLLKKEELNPLNTTTFGLGELISDAIKEGCRHFVIGLGGSSTNDCGVGMLSALGFNFLDKGSKPVKLGAKGIKDINRIDISRKNRLLEKCDFTIVSDVNNPLCGKEGCSYVFAPQKGATHKMVVDMDRWINNYALLVAKTLKKKTMNKKGAGAAGGLGYAFITFLNSKLVSGASYVMKATDLVNKIKKADVVVTGEGSLDNQTTMGKGPIMVAKLAKKYNKTVIAFAGVIKANKKTLVDNGIDKAYSINPKTYDVKEAMKKGNAYRNLKKTSAKVFKAYLLSK